MLSDFSAQVRLAGKLRTTVNVCVNLWQHYPAGAPVWLLVRDKTAEVKPRALHQYKDPGNILGHASARSCSNELVSPSVALVTSSLRL